jgi:hypothetical protein
MIQIGGLAVDNLINALTEVLLKEGVLGVIIVGLALWCWKLQQQLNVVQERRVYDALKIADAAHTFAGALDRNTETLKALAGD